jgi:hypothetical protein
MVRNKEVRFLINNQKLKLSQLPTPKRGIEPATFGSEAPVTTALSLSYRPAGLEPTVS